MSLRHTPRQSDRDLALHDAHINHAHSLVPPPPHAQSLPPPPPPPAGPHLNGAVQPPPPTAPPIPNGPAHNHHIMSPRHVSPATTNRAAVPLSIQKLTQANEQTWLLIGRVAEQMGDLEHALSAYENALRHNPMSLTGLTQVAGIARIKENYPKAIEYFQRVLSVQQENGEVWSALGHCYLMQDELQKAYAAYQQALYLLPNPKEDPKLWYGIGILYDRYGSLDNAEDAFASVLRMDKDFDKSNEILFRLGIIYKQQGKYNDSLKCFEEILRNPPSPLAHADIWFQIGHVYEQQKDHLNAKNAYERVVEENPGHAKVLQQLGWLYHQDGSTFQNQDLAIQYLTKSLEADPSDAQSWYLLGRAYMAGSKYNKAYEAYQQAVYRDGRNPTFWCSIGVLYFQINQFHDALDAYSRAIRINPYISEVWFDLGSLYESCNNQISDAIDAYARAAELDPMNPVISQRLQLLKQAQATGSALPAAPGPQDVHPTAYAGAVVPPPGPPLLLHATPNPHSRPLFRTDSRGPPGENSLSLPPPPQAAAPRPTSPGPFRGGPPPPVIIDESRHTASHTPLAPMDVDRPPMIGRHQSAAYPAGVREVPSRGPSSGLLLHHPVPQQQYQGEDIRGPATHVPQHPHDSYASRPLRVPSGSTSPVPSAHPHGSRPRSPPLTPYGGYSSGGRPRGPGQAGVPSLQRSPRTYPYDGPNSAIDRESGWERRGPIPNDHREWEREQRERERRSRHGSPSLSHRGHTPRDRSPRGPPSPRSSSHSRPYWEKPSGPGAPPGPHMRPSSPPVPPQPEIISRRYDPRLDGREHTIPREFEREREREVMVDGRFDPRYQGAPESVRGPARNGIPASAHVLLASSGHRGSESPHLSQASQPETKDRRRRGAKDKDTDSVNGSDAPPRKERKRRTNKRKQEEQSGAETPKAFPPPGDRAALSHQAPSFRVAYPYQSSKANGTPEPSTGSSGSGSASRSVQPSPTSATYPPDRRIDENYDEGIADALITLSHRGSGPGNGLTQLAPVTGNGRQGPTSPHALVHRNSISSHSSSQSMKRPLSPGLEDMRDEKRSRMDIMGRRVSPPSGGRRTPNASSRPSPIPFRTQPSMSHSPELPSHQYPPSPPLPAVLPPHPRPLGAGLSSHASRSSAPLMTLPPIATLSPTSTGSPTADDRMQVDPRPHSTSPPSRHNHRAKISNVLHHTSRSPPGARATPMPVVNGPKAEPVS